MSASGHSLVHGRSTAHQILLEAENEPEAWRAMASTWPWFGGVWSYVFYGMCHWWGWSPRVKYNASKEHTGVQAHLGNKIEPILATLVKTYIFEADLWNNLILFCDLEKLKVYDLRSDLIDEYLIFEMSLWYHSAPLRVATLLRFEMRTVGADGQWVVDYCECDKHPFW